MSALRICPRCGKLHPRPAPALCPLCQCSDELAKARRENELLRGGCEMIAEAWEELVASLDGAHPSTEIRFAFYDGKRDGYRNAARALRNVLKTSANLPATPKA